MKRLALCTLKHLRRYLLREMTHPDPAADPANIARVFLAVQSLIVTLERNP